MLLSVCIDAAQHLDSPRWFDWPYPSLRRLCGLLIWIHLLRHLLLLCCSQFGRAQCHLANRRWSIPLRLRTVLWAPAISPSTLRQPRRITFMLTENQSFLVGWTSIVGWLVVVTVQGYFGGKTRHPPMWRSIEYR